MNPGGPHRSRNNAFGCAVAGVLIALAWMPVSPALAFDQQDLDSCANKDAAPDLRIKGCTALIQSGKLSGNYLAAAHWDRGVAHTKRRDFDNAITDLDEAIRLEPQAALPMTTGVLHTPERATSIAPSPITTSRSGSIRKLRVP